MQSNFITLEGLYNRVPIWRPLNTDSKSVGSHSYMSTTRTTNPVKSSKQREASKLVQAETAMSYFTYSRERHETASGVFLSQYLGDYHNVGAHPWNGGACNLLQAHESSRPVRILSLDNKQISSWGMEWGCPDYTDRWCSKVVTGCIHKV
jgi:hypothetical protein